MNTAILYNGMNVYRKIFCAHFIPISLKQLLRIMKFVIFYILFLSICCLGSASAQKVSIDVKNATFRSVALEIQKQTGYSFSISKRYSDISKPVTLRVKEVSLDAVLDQLFKNQPFSYAIDGKIISLKDKPTYKRAPSLEDKPLQIQENIRGRVIDSLGNPLANASVAVKGKPLKVPTDVNGYFSIVASEGDILQVNFLGYIPRDINIRLPLSDIQLHVNPQEINEILVVNTGYQTLPKERTAGSFETIDNELLNRSISTNLFERLENVTNGLYTSQNDVGPDKYLIRGRSTILADAKPLIILDNFPFDGNLEDINPNDVENVTILKDASASSIWGARAGNGVIVVTTKKGKAGTQRISITSNITVNKKPDLYSLPRISSSDYIDIEQQLYELGYYQADENMHQDGYLFPPFTPVIQLLRQHKNNPTLTESELRLAIDAYRNYDVRRDLEKYFYRNSVIQQHALNVSGGTEKANYYISAGYDKDKMSLIGDERDRITIRSQNEFHLSKKFTIDMGLNFMQSNNTSGNNLGIGMQSGSFKSLYPYAKLVDGDGNGLPIYWNYTKDFIDDAQSKGLLNWEYSPLDEIDRREYKNRTRQVVANTGARYNLMDGLALNFRYQLLYTDNLVNNHYNKDAYYVRDVVNRFSNLNNNGNVTRPIPMGDIIKKDNSTSVSQQGRVQLNYDKIWADKHEVNAIAGWEIKELKSTGNTNSYFGYSKKGSTNTTGLNYNQQYPQYQYGILAPYVTERIPASWSISGAIDRYVSYFSNATYGYLSRYYLSGSTRVDASNLFGVKTNQKQVPLWSVGAAWQIDKEPDFNAEWVNSLRLRFTYGSQGNVSKRVSAYTTGRYENFNWKLNGLQHITIITPPNASLRWETIKMANIGLDFSLFNNRYYGSIEYYHKKGYDLLGSAPLDPTMGMSVNDGPVSYYGNLAQIKGDGVDLKIGAILLDRVFRWKTDWLYNYHLTKVTQYDMPVSAMGNAYLSDYMINPVTGRNINAIYAFKWAGLNAENGVPQGYYNNEISSDASVLYNQTPLSEMSYYPTHPTSYGALRNTFDYRNMSLSFNISYKFNYYFRKPSVQYSRLFESWSGHGDYNKRWQKPGDEKNTDVPAMAFPTNSLSESFYLYSDALIEKGDHIRLEDITASYTFERLTFLPVQRISINAYLSNLGVIWKANKTDIDPNHTYSLTPGKTYAIGINLTF